MKKVFVNGTFDILHTAHILLLNYAKSLGDSLIVAIDSDERIKEKKGASRPINNIHERTFMLANLKSVDQVCWFDSDKELEGLVKHFSPDIMVVGSDWENKKVIGSEYAKEVKFFERIHGYSTTDTIQSIANRRDL